MLPKMALVFLHKVRPRAGRFGHDEPGSRNLPENTLKRPATPAAPPRGIWLSAIGSSRASAGSVSDEPAREEEWLEEPEKEASMCSEKNIEAGLNGLLKERG